ncbi:TniQ family protein [Streptomyces roseoverticillatus]|uniref:TniQ family protein n=1 Tax=Streptomyces roseoverticillatus TaxID=66429 RepID=A0ABV3IMY3_9ACTN
MSKAAAEPLSPVLPVFGGDGAVVQAGDADIERFPGAGVRRLALVVPPVEGESFPSWVDRLAADHVVPPGVIAQALGVPARANTGSIFKPVLYGVVPTAAGLAAAGVATDITPGQMAAMHLSRYDGTALDFTALDAARGSSVQKISNRQWVLLYASRACPCCLADSDGVWPLWWHLGIAACCPVHRVLLTEICPACGIRLRQGYGRRPSGLSKARLADPVRCGNHTRQGRCEHDLRDLPTELVTRELADWQAQLLAVADGSPVQLAGRTVTGREWFTALEGLSALVRFAAPACPLADSLSIPEVARRALAADQEAGRRRTGGAPAALRTMPTGPALTLAVLTAVEPILTAADDDGLDAALSPWARAAATRRRTLDHNVLRDFALHGPLGEALERVAPHASRVASVARPAPSLATLTVRRVPQLMDEHDYRDLIAEHLPGTAEHSGRRLAALALARLAGATSWPQDDRELQVDPERADRVADVLVGRIADLEAFWRAITQAGERLLARSPVDYAHRRAALAHLREVPHPVLFALYRPLGLPVTRRRRQLAAIWLWSHLTSGDFKDAPGWVADERASTASLTEVYRRFRRALPDPVAEGLTAYGTALITPKGEA